MIVFLVYFVFFLFLLFLLLLLDILFKEVSLKLVARSSIFSSFWCFMLHVFIAIGSSSLFLLTSLPVETLKYVSNVELTRLLRLFSASS